MRFNFFQQAECVNRSNDCFTCSKTLEFLELCRDFAGINVRFVTFGIEHLGAFTDIAVKGQDVDHRQRVTFTHFIVVKVVRRSDFHAAGAFFHVGVFVANDRNTTVNQRQNDIFANQIFVTRIFRVNGYASIAQQGFRTGSRNHQIIFTVCGFRAVSQRIADVPHRTF